MTTRACRVRARRVDPIEARSANGVLPGGRGKRTLVQTQRVRVPTHDPENSRAREQTHDDPEPCHRTHFLSTVIARVARDRARLVGHIASANAPTECRLE